MSRTRDDLRNILASVVDAFDKDNTTLTEDEMAFLLDAVRTVTDNKISKYQACQLLNISRATFDNLVANGELPKGKKQAGFKELFWLKTDILKYITKRK